MLTFNRFWPCRFANSLRHIALPLIAVSLSATEPTSAPCGLCYATHSDGESFVIPLESTEVVMDVKPGLLEAEVTQTFTNHTEQALEATYLYPLPEDATITSFELRYADRVIKSVVREKKKAQQEYDTAKMEGKKAALVVQHDPSLFSTAVANFLPGETVKVVFKFIQPLAVSSDHIEVRFPMVTGEKYFPANTVPGSPGASAPTPPKVDASSVSSHHVYAYDIWVSGIPVQSITSPSHRIQVERTKDGQYRVALAEEITIPDRDFVLRIATQPLQKLAPTVVIQKTAEGTFGLLTLFPPTKSPVSVHAAVGRDFLFLLDHSGSMEGPRIQSARLGLQAALKTLSPLDRFQIVVFDSEYSFYQKEWIPVSRHTVAEANKYIKKIEANSGTEMQPALNASLDFIAARDQGRSSIIIFLTDGDVGNESALFDLLDNKIGRTRLFTFGIGQAPNNFLLNKMAERGRGQARFIGDDNAVAGELADLFATLDAPVLTDLKLTFVDQQGVAIPAFVYPERLSDVFVGRPLQTFFSTSGGVPSAVIVTGMEDGRVTRIETPLETSPIQGDGLEKQFGRMEYDEFGLKRSRAQTPEARAAAEAEMLQTSLNYQLVTEFTSRVAIEEKTSRDPAAPLRITTVPQYREADQTATGGGDETVILSPFEVSSTEEDGYEATSTLAGTRIRTNLRDIGSGISVITPQVFEDLGVTRTEDLLPFLSMPDYGSGFPRAGSETELLNDLPIATPVDPATVSELQFQSQNAVRSTISQLHSGTAVPSFVRARIGDEGFASATVQSSFSLGSARQEPALAIVSWTDAPRPQLSAYFSTRNSFGGNHVEVQAQARKLDGYGETQLVRAEFEHEIADDTSFIATVAWSDVRREDPLQFRRGIPAAEYDGLGFFNLDLLTAEIRRLEDLVAQIGFSKSLRTTSVEHFWAATVTWHNQDLPWVTPLSATPVDLRHQDLSIDLFYQLKLKNDRLAISANAGATDRRSQTETKADRVTTKLDFGVTGRIVSGVALFANVSDETLVPDAPSGDLIETAGTWAMVSGETERREKINVGARVEALDGRLSFETSFFAENVSNESLRSWSWEREHANSGPVSLNDGVVQLPVNNELRASWHRQGSTGSIGFSPTPTISVIASWSDAWSDGGPYQGGDRKASVLAKYTFDRGLFKGFSFGAGTAARNRLTFDDGYELKGGVRFDTFMVYRRRFFGPYWTTFQLNLENLTDRSWQETRFSPDHGRGVLLSVTQEF